MIKNYMKRGEIYFFDLNFFPTYKNVDNFLKKFPKKILRLNINHGLTIFSRDTQTST